MINKTGSFEAFSYLKPRSTTRQGRLRAKVSTRVHSPENIIQTIGHLGKGACKNSNGSGEHPANLLPTQPR
jgi:hypothetical protein